MLLKITRPLSLEQMNTIPEGYNNSIAWNFAHILVTQQLLHYRLCGLPMQVDDDLVARYRKGSVPKQGLTAPEREGVTKLLMATPDLLETDLEAGKFAEMQPYTTSYGITLTNISDAVSFNNLHEGLHIGYIMSMKKAMHC